VGAALTNSETSTMIIGSIRTSSYLFQPSCAVGLTINFLSDQLVILETVTPHKKVRISGLDDSGYLLTLPDPRAPGDPDTITLDYTSNSFDMMGGLIRRK
jgi:hypothetical protein